MEGRPPRSSASTSASSSSGSTSTPALGRDELGRAADRRRDDGAGRGHRLERREPERLAQARLADDVGARDPHRDVVVADAADDPDPLASLERAAERAVPDEGQRALAAMLERAREAEHVLPLGEPAEAEERGAVRLSSRALRARPRRRAGAKRSRSTPQSITSVLPRACGSADSRRSRSQRETAMTADARSDDVTRGTRAHPASSRCSRRPDRGP